RAGNRVKLLVNGETSAPRRYENAEGAEVLLVKTFIYANDESARKTADLLIERAKAGATVILQYDVKGSIVGMGDVGQMVAHATAALPAGEKDIIHELREAGVIVVPANSPLRAVEAHEWAQNTSRLLRDPGGAVERSAVSLRIIDHSDHEKYWITGKRD